MENKHVIHPALINFTAALIVVCLTVYILIIGKTILVPVVAAVVLWYLLSRLTALFSLNNKIPNAIAMTLAIISTIALLTVFINMVSNSINGIINEAPLYQQKVQQLVNLLSDLTGKSLDIHQLVSKINITLIFSSIALTLTNIASNLGVIIIYVLFLILEQSTFDTKLKALSPSHAQYQKSANILDKIANDINTYMKIKTGVSLLTGILSYIALFAFDVPYAQFWSVLIFVLNFIPTIGAIIAVSFTLLAVSVHFTDLASFAALTAILITIQMLIGNVLEPKMMGKDLNLSPMIILLSLAFWGSIWGVVGMFLCVPLMTIINIVLANFASTRFLAVLFAADASIIETSSATKSSSAD